MASRGTQDLINDAFARLSHRHPRELTDARNFGVRMAAKVANGAGSWKFIISYLVFSALSYTVGHQVGVFHFDPYPYQFYTFLVSVLAILLAQTILLFQNQQADIENKIAHNAYDQIAEIDKVQQVQIDILNAIKSLAEDIQTMQGQFEAYVEQPE